MCTLLYVYSYCVEYGWHQVTRTQKQVVYDSSIQHGLKCFLPPDSNIFVYLFVLGFLML